MTSQNKSFLRHAAVYGFGTLALRAVTIVLLPLYTRYLAPAEFGVLEILTRLGDVFVICLMVNGVRMAALTFYKQAADERERERTAATITLFLAIILLGGGLLAIPFASHLGSLIGVDDPILVCFGIVAVMLEATTATPLVLIQARVESGCYVCVTLAMSVCRIGLTIIAVAVLGWGVWGVLAAMAFTSGVFGVILTVREFVKGSFRPEIAKFPELARFALPLVPVGICSFVLHSGDRFFLMRFAGAEELGLYALGYKLAGMASLLGVVPVYRVWSARLYDVFELPNAPLLVGRMFTRILAGYLFVGVGLCLLQNEVMAVLGSPRYAGATAVVGLIVLAGYFMTAANLADAAFFVRRRTDLKPWISLISGATALALYACLIPRFGAMGAAYATLCGFFVRFAVTVAVSQRVFRVEYQPARVTGMLILAIALALGSRYLGTGPFAVLAKLALWTAWPALLWVTGMIASEEKAWMLSRLRRLLHRLSTLPIFGDIKPDA